MRIGSTARRSAPLELDHESHRALEAQEKAKAAKDEVVADDFKKDFGLEDDLDDDIDL